VRNDTELRAWLMTVLRNLHIDSKRSIAVRYSIPCDSLPLSAPEPEATPLWRQIDVEVLYATLPRLSPPMRRAFELRLAGHGMRQIARQLGIAEATVGVRLHRARRVLKKLILVHYLRESAAEGRRPPQGFVPSIVAPSNDVYQEPPEVRTQGMMTRRAVSAKRTK
jgi:predicted RNA polymerase sigma factor